MIDYARPAKRPTASDAAADLAVPRTPQGRISFSREGRAPVGTVVLRAGESVTLSANGTRRITSADGTSRTVPARRQ